VGEWLHRREAAARLRRHSADLFRHELTADGTDEEMSLDQVRVGDRLRVRPGEAVPVDGAVTEGLSAVDESMVSGESVPAEKSVAAKVIGGTSCPSRSRGSLTLVGSGQMGSPTLTST
jgi:P-type Cu+ transporter